jgi:hypothetical protein
MLTLSQAIWLQTLLLNGVKPGTNTSVIPVSAIERVATGISVESGQAYVLIKACALLYLNSRDVNRLFPELSPVVYGGGQDRSTYRGHGA